MYNKSNRSKAKQCQSAFKTWKKFFEASRTFWRSNDWLTVYSLYFYTNFLSKEGGRSWFVCLFYKLSSESSQRRDRVTPSADSLETDRGKNVMFRESCMFVSYDPSLCLLPSWRFRSSDVRSSCKRYQPPLRPTPMLCGSAVVFLSFHPVSFRLPD